MLVHESNEVTRRVARKGGLGEVGVGGDVVCRRSPGVGEVASSAAGNADLFARRLRMIEEQDPPPALPGTNGAHHPRGSGSKNDGVEFADQVRLPSAGFPVCDQSGKVNAAPSPIANLWL